MKRHRMGPDDAEETVQAAIQQFLAAGGVADPARPRELLHALGSRVNGIAVNHRRKRANQAIALTKDGDEPDAEDETTGEARLVRDDHARRTLAALVEDVRGDTLLAAMLHHMIDGIDEPAELARALAVDVREVYNARRRLKMRVEAVTKRTEGA